MGCLLTKPVVTNKVSSDPVTSLVTQIAEQNTFESKYSKGKELGKGGYSTVYEVTSKKNGQRYAVKEILKSSLKKEDEVGLHQEIDILKSLNHVHIVQFNGFYEEKVKYYVVLELLEGGELFDRIVQKSCYSEKEARDLVYVLLNAIKYCHDRHVVHRDLKPENLLMANKYDDSNVKIADFGFAKHAEGLTLTTQCGSPGYVAPEILENKKYGKPADMWSTGVITYILLGGYPPFHDDKDQASLFRKIRKGIYEFHADYWDHVSEEAMDLIRGLLTVDMHKRLTVEQALQHSWIRCSDTELASRNLESNLKEFKRFHATRKFRAAAKAVIAIRRMSRSFSASSESSLSSNPNNNSSPEASERPGSQIRPPSLAESSILALHDE